MSSGRSLVDIDSWVTSSQPHRGWIEETSLCLCEGRGEVRNFSRNSYALPFPASRVFLSFSRQRRLSVRRPVARLVLIGSLILIRGKSSLNDQRDTRIQHTRSSSASYSSSRPHSGIVCTVCVFLAPSQNFVQFPPQMASSLASSLENLLALFLGETYAGLFESIFCTTAIITVLVTCTMLTDNDAAASLKGASIYDADS